MDNDVRSPDDGSIATRDPALTLLPEIRAFGKDLIQWWRIKKRRNRRRVQLAAEANRILATRTEAAMQTGRSLRIDVAEDCLSIRGVPFPENAPGRSLARHLYLLDVRSITLERGVSCAEFVRFLETCESEAVGEGVSELLAAAQPEHVLLEVASRPARPRPAPVAPRAEEPVPVEDRPAVQPLAPRPQADPVRLAALEALLKELRVSDQESRPAVLTALVAHFHETADQENPADHEALLARLLETGHELTANRRFEAWVESLVALRDAMSQGHSLAGLQLMLRLVEGVANLKMVSLIFEHYESAGPRALELLEQFLSLLPATALATVVRCAAACHSFPFEAGSKPRLAVQRYLRLSATYDLSGLTELVKDEDVRLAQLAVETLGDLPGGGACDLIKLALEHPKLSVRYDAVRQAACLPLREQVECLALGLKDSSAPIRRLAAKALGDCCVPRATRPLLETAALPEFARRDPTEQVAVYRALAASGRPEALFKVEERIIPPRQGRVRRLLTRLRPAAPDVVREELIEALAKLGSPQVLEILKRGARCSDTTVARLCAAVLQTPQ